MRVQKATDRSLLTAKGPVECFLAFAAGGPLLYQMMCRRTSIRS